jgi:hypothetical protein
MDLESCALALSLPPVYRTLITCVRDACAIIRRGRYGEPQWSLLDVQHAKQGVDAFLFPWLAAHYPENFSMSSAHPDSAPGAWRARALRELQRAALRQRSLPIWRRAFHVPGWVWSY